MTRQELFQVIKKKKSFLCIGLDSDIDKIPDTLKIKKIQFSNSIKGSLTIHTNLHWLINQTLLFTKVVEQ